MDLRNLNTFVQVAEVGSFTKAAEILGYSQPTISFQIKQLEKELSVQLFERIGHNINLTAQGREMLSYAQKICRMIQEMATVPEGQKDPIGEIRLAMSDSLCNALVLNGFAKFQKMYPHISIKMKTAGTGELMRLLDHNEVDIVCTLDSHGYSTNYVIVDEEKVGVHFVCAAENKLAKKEKLKIEDLLEEPFFLTEKGMSYRRLLDEKLAQRSIEIHPRLEIGSPDLICKLMNQNTGISFLPDFVTEASVRSGKLVRLDVEDFDIVVWKQLMYHKDKWMSPPMRATIEYLAGMALI